MRKRKIMWQWFRDKIDAVPDFLDTVWISDETHVLLSGHVNSKKNIFWGSTPPEHWLQRPLHCLKCTVWVVISKHCIITILVEDDNEHLWQSTQIDMSRCFVSSVQHLVDGKRSSGSASGSSRTVPPYTPQKNHWYGYISVFLADRLVASVIRSGRRIQPTKIPQFLYLWGYLKDRIYVHNPQNISDLKRAIKTTIKAIPRDECNKVIHSFVRRIQVYLQRQGAHFVHIFWALKFKDFLKYINLFFLSALKPNILLMHVKFCNHINKPLEIIQILMMIVFFFWVTL